MLDSNYIPADVKLQKPTVHAKHPFVDAESHRFLLEYCVARLQLGKTNRDNNLARYAQMDKLVGGWIQLSEEDRKRLRAKHKTGSAKAIEMNLPIAMIHLDDMMTFFADIFAPISSMFHHQGDEVEQESARQMVGLMNTHSVHAGYYREILRACYNVLKYNVGGLHVYWTKEMGFKMPTDGSDVPESTIIWQGNKMQSLDVYNLLYDSSVHPTKIGQDAEFAGEASLMSHYQLQRAGEAGVYFNLEDALATKPSLGEFTYYVTPAKQVSGDTGSGGKDTDWVSLMQGFGATEYGAGYEVVELYIWLNPLQCKLVSGAKGASVIRNRLELWKITILSGDTIIGVEQVNNIHTRIPYALGLINDDLLATSQKSVGETIGGMQDLASFLVNTHIQGVRKNIWGLTVYDSLYLDLKSIPDGEVAAKVALKTSLPANKSIESVMWHNSKPVDTAQAMRDVGTVMDLIQLFYPTQALPGQVAGIDRAVTSQISAVMQGSTRRQHKNVRLIDEVMMRPARFIMYYNILQFQPSGEVTGVDGKKVNIDRAALQDSDLLYIIGQGIKALDKQATAGQLKEVLFAILQSQAAIQEVDILKMLQFYGSLLDIDINVASFVKQPPQAEGGLNPAVPLQEQAPAGGVVNREMAGGA